MASKVKLSRKAKIDKAKRICALYSEGKHTIASCCEAEGLNYYTFQNWAQSNLTHDDILNGNYRPGFIQEVQELYKRALETNETNYKMLLKDAVRESVLKRAHGISYTETHTQARLDIYGNLVGTIITKMEKYLPPDVTLLIFLAQCLKIFDYHNCIDKEFTNTVKNQFQHLTDEELTLKRMELESKLKSVQY